jgi:hypothetical protein
MSLPRLEDVFKRSGLPTYTLIEPAEYNHLKVALRTPGRGVVVEGPSGIGKTTAVRKAAAEIGLDGRAQLLSGRDPSDREIIADLPSWKNAGLVIIDDFHRLDESTKGEIANYLKQLADSEDVGTKIVLIGINKAGDILINSSPDLNNRIDTIHFEPDSNAGPFTSGCVQPLRTTRRRNGSIWDPIQKEKWSSFHRWME